VSLKNTIFDFVKDSFVFVQQSQRQ